MFLSEGVSGSQEEVRGVREDWERDEDSVSREESSVSRGPSSHGVILDVNIEHWKTPSHFSLV